MNPDRITIEKDNVTLAEVDRYRMVELAGDRFELTLEGISPFPGTGCIANWDNFEVIANIGRGQIVYTPCRWTRIHESGTLVDLTPNSMTVISGQRIERIQPELALHRSTSNLIDRKE